MVRVLKWMTSTGTNLNSHQPKIVLCALLMLVTFFQCNATMVVANSSGSFGQFGGCYIPETLTKAHHELWTEYKRAIQDPEYLKEVDRLRKEYVGGVCLQRSQL
jgi:hypothetical protein